MLPLHPENPPSAELLQLITDAEQAITTLLHHPQCEALRNTLYGGSLPTLLEYDLHDLAEIKSDLFPIVAEVKNKNG
jgi:phage baseplate assembly protein W